MWNSMNSHRKWALAIVLILFGVSALLAIQDRPQNPFEAIPGALLSALAMLIVSVAAVCTLFVPADTETGKLRILDRFLPAIALIASVALLSFIDGRHSRYDALAFATDHADDLAGPPPQSVPHFQGIPDGGSAIIASPGRNPMTFSAKTRLRLTNGDMHSCRKLDEKLWLCGFG